ncbi:MAG: hypothetical protein NZM06_06955 [Chloroherpetonaceae bacterium]|nr:hypothetical protein [Chloroherpetonaceae bacterium]MDW8437777.1 hypothetical protein [Chloroherpetonaceae bacterium]
MNAAKKDAKANDENVKTAETRAQRENLSAQAQRLIREQMDLARIAFGRRDE